MIIKSSLLDPERAVGESCLYLQRWQTEINAPRYAHSTNCINTLANVIFPGSGLGGREKAPIDQRWQVALI